MTTVGCVHYIPFRMASSIASLPDGHPGLEPGTKKEGSQARGDVHEESDWDILILLDKEKITSADFDTYAYPLIDLGWQLGEYFSTKLYTFNEWMKRKGTPFFKNVELDGIEL